jgi:hypothetical protein
MAAYTVSTLPGEPIIWLAFSSDFKPPQIAESSAAIIEAAQQMRPFIVADLRDLDFTLPEAGHMVEPVRAGQRAIFHDEHIKAFMAAVEGGLYRTAIKGLNSEAFGFVSNIFMYATPEEALEAARAAVAEAQDSNLDAARTA